MWQLHDFVTSKIFLCKLRFVRWSTVMQQFYTFESSLWASFFIILMKSWQNFGCIQICSDTASLWKRIPSDNSVGIDKIAYNTFFDARALLAIVGPLMFFPIQTWFFISFSGWKKCTDVSSPVTSSLSCLWPILLYIFNIFLHFCSRSFFCSFVRIWGIHLAHTF